METWTGKRETQFPGLGAAGGDPPAEKIVPTSRHRPGDLKKNLVPEHPESNLLERGLTSDQGLGESGPKLEKNLSRFLALAVDSRPNLS